MRLPVFLLLTLGHLAVVSGCLWSKARRELRDADDFAFLAVVLGFGSLQAILHGLASTVGISFPSGALAVGGFGTLLAVWTIAGRSRPLDGGEAHGLLAPLQLPWLALPGLVVVTALLLQWYSVTSVSLRVAGTDAAHYHVPAAVNYAHGASLFGFVATPHLYPLGASVWAAWLLQPLPGPVLLDLMTLPSVVLLIVSLGLLFRTAIGEAGLVWSPWLVILLLTAPLFRISLLPGADLPYAAAFVALFAQSFAIWRHSTVRSVDLLALGLSAGLLLGSKTTGAVSTLLIVCVFGLLLLAERVVPWKRRFTWSAAPASVPVAIVGLVLGGGIWLIRNWILFDSPVAPSGFSIAGHAVFPGEPYPDGGYYYSVLKDMRDLDSYRLPARFAVHAKRLIGPWFLPASLALLVFLVDATGDRTSRRRPSGTTNAKLVLLLTISILAVAHIALLIPAPWTSLEWTHGLAIRYILPLLVLYLALMVLVLFPEALLRWQAFGATRWMFALAAMWFVALHYANHSSVPGLPEPEWFPVLDTTWLLAAAATVAAWYVKGRHRFVARVAGAAWLAVTLGAVSHRIARENEQLLQDASRLQQHQSVSASATQVSSYRCVYLHVLAFERQSVGESSQRRFFVASRFDEPLELQGPALENLVFDARGRTELPGLLARGGPGKGGRDYIVIDDREHRDGQSARLAFRQAAARGLQAVGACGHYEVYRVETSPEGSGQGGR
jgi:hypothetical protein